MPQLPDIRGGNDPTRAALLNMLSRGRAGATGQAPQMQPRPQMQPQAQISQPAAPSPMGMQGQVGTAPVSGGDHLAEALKAFAESGFTPEDIEAIRQFFFVLREIIAPFESSGSPPQSPQETPRMGFSQVPSQSAQNAPVGRGVRGY